MAANELTLRVLRSPPHGCFFLSEVCSKCSGIMHFIVLYCRYPATQSLLHSHHCSTWNVNQNNWLPWQWSSYAQINHKTVSVTVARRHILYEQKNIGFQCSRKSPCCSAACNWTRTTGPAVGFPLQKSYLLVRLLCHLPNPQSVTHTTVWNNDLGFPVKLTVSCEKNGKNWDMATTGLCNLHSEISCQFLSI